MACFLTIVSPVASQFTIKSSSRSKVTGSLTQPRGAAETRSRGSTRRNRIMQITSRLHNSETAFSFARITTLSTSTHTNVECEMTHLRQVGRQLAIANTRRSAIHASSRARTEELRLPDLGVWKPPREMPAFGTFGLPWMPGDLSTPDTTAQHGSLFDLWKLVKLR